MKARIGIPQPTLTDSVYNQTCWPQYARAVELAGGEAIPISLGLQADSMGQLAEGLSGFVLPGSPADVDPGGYGAVRDPAAAPADPARETCDRVLLEHAALHGKPVLAICFGLQLLNVWCGGTLVQDVLPIPVNHAAGSQVAVAHSVLVEQESLLAGLLSAAEAPAHAAHQRKLPVNSSHHQAISSVGDDLAVVARSVEDQVIEAVEGRIGEAAMIGVQWHPERSVEISAASRALFMWLVAEAEDRRGTTTLEGQWPR